MCDLFAVTQQLVSLIFKPWKRVTRETFLFYSFSSVEICCLLIYYFIILNR